MSTSDPKFLCHYVFLKFGMQYYMVCFAYLLIISMKAYVMPQKFCGDNLSRILSQYCISYNTPGHRVKRQIIEECCRNSCSLQYLLTNYCEKYNSEALERYLEQKNEIKKEQAIQNENIQQSSAESYLHRMDPFPQVSEIYFPRSSQTHHVGHVHNSQWNSSSQHLHTSHERKRRKTKPCVNKNKNSKRRNVFQSTDLAIKLAPEPKLGQIEDSQKPFYIFKHYNR